MIYILTALLVPLIVVTWMQVIRQIVALYKGPVKCDKCGEDGWDLVREDEDAIHARCIKCGWLDHLKAEEFTA